MAEPGNPVALLQKLVQGTGLPETMSESSELMMQCEEEALDPWQNANDDARSEGNKSNTSGPNTVPAGDNSAALPSVSATALPISPALFPQILQQLQVVSSPAIMPGIGTPAQPIIITSPTVPVSNPVGSAMQKTIGFILNGRTYLTAGASQPLITPKICTPAQATTVHVPVTITLTGPTGIQTVNAMATAGVSQLNLSPPPVVTTTTPAVVPPSTAAESGEGVSNQQQQPALPSPVVSPSPQPAPVATEATSVTVAAVNKPLPPPPRPRPPPPPSPPAPSTSTFQLRVPSSHSKASKSCSRCGSPYKMIASLRGYMCMCNKPLMKAIQALEPTKKKEKRPPKQRLLSSSFRSPGRPPAASRFSRPSQGSSEEEEEEEEAEEEAEDEDTRGKLIILVEDFYYGVYRGANTEKRPQENAITFKCHLCDKRLKNNLKMMVHTKHHVEMDQQYEAETQTTCQHCFRSFASPLSLQYHVESVHSQAESSTKCRICELAYENEPVFLQHMKNTHKPGEMPYICQVCGFRSSFYLDVIFHFRDLHSNSTHLLCPYCLKVFRSSSNYQLHYSRHQKKSVLHCDKCRLQFLFMKERAEHKLMHHNTHRTPHQLEGLKPGTRVTIRTYATVPPGPAPEHRVVDVTSMPPPPEPPQPARQPTPTRSITPTSSPLSPKRLSPKARTPNREEASNTASPTSTPTPLPVPTRKIPSVNQHDLMTKFEKHKSSAETASCVECTFEIPSYVQHYPTYVHCSLCRYSTCCSRSYANHMINNHVSRKTGRFSKYLSMFRPCQRETLLYCLSCDFTTEVGDTMANHLVENPEHYGSTDKAREGFSGGYKRFLFIPNKALQKREIISLGSSNLISTPVRASDMTSTDEGVSQPVTRSSVAARLLEKVTAGSPAGKTDKMKKLANGTEVAVRKDTGASLSFKQLKILLFALCSGIPQAAARFQTQPALIQAWLIDRKGQGRSKGRRGLGPRAADRLAEWVLARREQQLSVDEETLFQKAKECVGGSDPGLGHDWAVDFLLQHELGVQMVGASAGRALPQSVEEGVRSFARFMKKQVGAQGFGTGSVGAVDELAVFVDLERLGRASSLTSAFRLTDLGEPLMDVVLSAMADGTLLPAMVFLKGSPPSCTAAVPASVFLEAQPEGFSDEERLDLWLSKVWRPYINPGGGGKGLLVMDPYRGHLADDFLASLNSANTLPALVPKACSCCLQPLEACSGPVLREFLQACWSQQVTSAPESLLRAQPAELALLLIGWLAELLQVLGARPDLLQRSFKTVMEPLEETQGVGAEDGSVTGLVQELTTALLQNNPLEVDREGEDEDDRAPVASGSRHKLKQVFDKDSSLESFHGFEEAEIGN
ncbi:hypothetical protein ACEWY4_024127 [Coilia grayii]|uniref:Pogo transposable element derived with ZNF domain a n=1 Tax=Coilia grayii TaxID=363190 RepID=A0ABD1J0E1_9TELE